ncbi:MAG: serine/threonine-protein kinase, partial [Planctomycetota bacterium]
MPKTIAGRYEVERELGRGGMGAVYQVYDTELERRVALKVILARLEGDEATLQRFVAEARATAQLQHPGIVPIYDVGLDVVGQVYFTMKLVEGRTLKQLVALVRKGGSEIATEYTRYRLLQVFLEITRALFFAHERGIVHRDLKPQNIMIGPYGEVQVMDWGLAKVLGRAEVAAASSPPGDRVVSKLPGGSGLTPTIHGAVMGTPGYMPPEQARGEVDAIGPRSDVYSLGGILYFLLTGAAPFRGADSAAILLQVRAQAPTAPRENDRSVAPELDAICMKALAKRVEDRYGSAQELGRDVQAFLEHRPVSVYRGSVFERAGKALRRHRALVRAG